MNHDFGGRGLSHKRETKRKRNATIQHLLAAEFQFLRSISAEMSLPEVLTGISSALDCQIGNVVSLISLPVDVTSDLSAISMNAAFFGLYTFCTERIVDEDGEVVGSIAIYSSVPRHPCEKEFQLIDRAKFLAAIAIKLHVEAEHQDDCVIRGKPSMRGSVFE